MDGHDAQAAKRCRRRWVAASLLLCREIQLCMQNVAAAWKVSTPIACDPHGADNASTVLTLRFMHLRVCTQAHTWAQPVGKFGFAPRAIC